jgi:hypothetical protein
VGAELTGGPTTLSSDLAVRAEPTDSPECVVGAVAAPRLLLCSVSVLPGQVGIVLGLVTSTLRRLQSSDSSVGAWLTVGPVSEFGVVAALLLLLWSVPLLPRQEILVPKHVWDTLVPKHVLSTPSPFGEMGLPSKWVTELLPSKWVVESSEGSSRTGGIWFVSRS